VIDCVPSACNQKNAMNWKIKALLVFASMALAVFFGLPLMLKTMGLHPHYKTPEFNLAGKRALLITTSHGTMGDTGRATGVFGSEMSIPYFAFLDAGLTVDLASIQGGEIPVQPWSMSWPMATPEDRRFLDDPVAMGKLANSIPISKIIASGYDIVFIAGGWGAAYDLAQSAELARLVSQANAAGGILGSVCHGALGFLNATNADGSPLLAGRRVTAVTDLQIKQLGIEITPLHPETELRAAKAAFESRTAWRDFFATHTVVDGNLVTGQNQNSGYETAHRMLELLAARSQ
jgi:putative intracellular protease/amidase